MRSRIEIRAAVGKRRRTGGVRRRRVRQPFDLGISLVLIVREFPLFLCLFCAAGEVVC